MSVNIHCAMLCSQSSYLQSLIESNTSDAVIILPEVNILYKLFMFYPFNLGLFDGH